MKSIPFLMTDVDEKSYKNNINSTSQAQAQAQAQANIPKLSPSSPDTVTSPMQYKPNIHRMESSLNDFSLETKGGANDKSGDNMEHNHEKDEMKEIELKTDEIFSCLSGVYFQKDSSPESRKSRDKDNINHNNDDDDDDDDNEKVVDLWHLRQLAISRRGLLSATIRKRVWLKLVGANEHILTSSSASLPTHFSKTTPSDTTCSSNANLCKTNELEESDISMIKNDIHNCAWNVKDEIKLVRKQHRGQERDKKEKNGLNHKKESHDESSLASLDSGCSSITAGRITPQLIPEAIRAFPRFGPNVPSPHASGASTPVSSIGTPNICPSITPIGIQNISINENSNIPSIIKKEKSKYRRRRKEEHAILLNIITSILRKAPEKDSVDHDSDLESDADTVIVDNINKLYYFRGMHNVIAPLLITLESPSLTSLVFNCLSQNHFYDAMGPTFENIQVAIRLIFIPLLEKVDSSLHNYIVKDAGINDPCVFALPWVLCWFTGEIGNYNIVARLFDVFISSHASFPVYLSVAILTNPSNRKRILMTPCDKSNLVSVIRSLPSTTAAEANAMDAFEDMIEVALSYMSLNPIQQILSMCKKNQDVLVKDSLKLTSAVKMIKKPPSWAYTPTAPTDWSLIKQSKSMRDLSPASRLEKKKILMAKKKSLYCHQSKEFAYEMALDASGLSRQLKDSIRKPPKKISRYSVRLIILLLLIIIVLSTLSINKKSTIGVKDNRTEESQLKYEVEHELETTKEDVHSSQNQDSYNEAFVIDQVVVETVQDDQEIQEQPTSIDKQKDYSELIVTNQSTVEKDECNKDMQKHSTSSEKQEDCSRHIITDQTAVKKDRDNQDMQRQPTSIEKKNEHSEVIVVDQATVERDEDDKDTLRQSTPVDNEEDRREIMTPIESVTKKKNDEGNKAPSVEGPTQISGLKLVLEKLTTKIKDSDLLFIFEYVVPEESEKEENGEGIKTLRNDGLTQRSSLKSIFMKVSTQIQRIDEYLQKDSDLLFILE